MKFEKKYTSLTYKKELISSSSEQSVQSDITLPDYYPDIVSIVNCFARPNVFSVGNSADRINVEGNCVFSVVYRADDDRTYCYEQRVPFSKQIDVKSDDNAVCRADAKTQYINCRASSQRKIEIRCSLAIEYKCEALLKKDIFESCDGLSLEINSESRDVSQLRDMSVKYFNVSETVDISSTQPDISQIVFSAVKPEVSDVKLISGKILLKGELHIKLLYLSKGNPEFQRHEASIPFSQIFESDCTEKSTVYVNLDTSSCEVYARADSAGALKLYEVSAGLRVKTEIYENVRLNVIDDVFSLQYALTPVFDNQPMITDCKKITETYLFRQNVSFGEKTFSEIIDINIKASAPDHEYDGRTLNYSGNLTVGILAKDSENSLIYSEKTLDYEFSKSIDFNCENMNFESVISAGASSFNIISDNEIEIRAEFEISTLCFGCCEARIVRDFEINEESKKQESASRVTLYFARSGEKVWQIAKKFNTSVESVMNENGLSSKQLENDKKLIIIS